MKLRLITMLAATMLTSTAFAGVNLIGEMASGVSLTTRADGVREIVSKPASADGHSYDESRCSFRLFWPFLQERGPSLRSGNAPDAALLTFLNVTRCASARKIPFLAQAAAAP